MKRYFFQLHILAAIGLFIVPLFTFASSINDPISFGYKVQCVVGLDPLIIDTFSLMDDNNTQVKIVINPCADNPYNGEQRVGRIEFYVGKNLSTGQVIFPIEPSDVDYGSRPYDYLGVGGYVAVYPEGTHFDCLKVWPRKPTVDYKCYLDNGNGTFTDEGPTGIGPQ